MGRLHTARKTSALNVEGEYDIVFDGLRGLRGRMKVGVACILHSGSVVVPKASGAHI